MQILMKYVDLSSIYVEIQLTGKFVNFLNLQICFLYNYKMFEWLMKLLKLHEHWSLNIWKILQWQLNLCF